MHTYLMIIQQGLWIMGKINIEIDTTDSFTENNKITFNADDCTENQIANTLLQIFLIVIRNNLVRPSILV